MANSTLQPNKHDSQDDQLNPGQQHYNREFNDIAKNYGRSADGGQENANIARANLRDKESSSGLAAAAGAKNSPKDKEGHGSWATNISSMATQQAIPVKVPFFKKKRTGVIGGIVGTIISVLAFFGLVLPNYAIVNLKEVAVDKFIKDQLAVYEPRTGIIMNKKISGGPEVDCTLVKVRCRFQGMSDKGIERLRQAGFEVETKPNRLNPLNKNRITKMSYTVDGKTVEVNARNYRQIRRNDPQFRAMEAKTYKPRYGILADKTARKWQMEAKIWRGNQLKEATDQKSFRQKFREALLGQADPNTGRLKSDSRSVNDAALSQEERDRRSAQLGDAADGVQAEADKLAEDYASGKVIPSLADADSPTTEASAAVIRDAAIKGSIKGAILGPIGTADSACSVYYMIAAVGFGAKVIAAEQMIRAYFVFSNTADAIKSGDATPQQVSRLGDLLSSKDENGRTFADSFGYQYMAYGSMGDSGQTLKYKLGGGMTGKLVDLKSYIDSLGGGTACKVVTNPFVQAGAFIGYIAATIFSGGTVNVASIAGSIAGATAIAVAQAIVTPMLTRLVAGVLVTGDENGKDWGNIITAGGGAFFARNGAKRGLVPLTRQEALAYDQEASKTFAAVTAAERYDANPFDISNPRTPAGGMFTRIAPYATSPYSESSLRGVAKVLNPITVFGSALSTMSPAAQAAANSREYEICTDPDYANLEGGTLATDPFCNPKYGFDLTKLNSIQYDPDAVIEYMLTNKYIDNDGNPQGDYAKFITDCIDNNKPIAAEANEEFSLPAYCFNKTDRTSEKQTNWRLYFLDTTIFTGMQEQIDGEKLNVASEAAAANPADPNAPATGSSPSPAGLPQGSPQQLAQQILDSGKVAGAADYINQIKAYARGDFSCNINTQVLQLILAASKVNSFYITSLNRKCTGTIINANDRHTRSGGGHAVDIDNVSGSDSTGALQKDVDFLRALVPVMPQGTEIGQANCRSSAGRPLNAPGMKQVPDACNHIHLGVPVP